MTLRSRSMTLKLHGKEGQIGDFGSITVHAEETIDSKIVTEMRLRCSNLDNKDLFSKSVITLNYSKKNHCQFLFFFNWDLFINLLFYHFQDPFLRISRVVESGNPVPICKTEVVNNNLDPVWKPLCITLQQYASKVNLFTPSQYIFFCILLNIRNSTVLLLICLL